MEKDEATTSVEDEMFLVDDDEETNLTDKFLLFNLGDEEYGIDISKVTGIEEMQKITYIPDMPPFVKGVINLRGRVIPVLDLRLRFGMDERTYDDRTCIVVTEIAGVTIGFIVDTVEEVLEIPESQVEPAPRFKTVSGQDRYIAGMGKVGEAVKILLDVEKLVVDEEVRAVQEAVASAGR